MYVHTLCHTHYTLNQLCFAGNEFGEPVIAERQIRISDIPFRKEDDEEPEDDDNEHEEVELVSPEVRDLLLSFLSLSLCLSISLSSIFHSYFPCKCTCMVHFCMCVSPSVQFIFCLHFILILVLFSVLSSFLISPLLCPLPYQVGNHPFAMMTADHDLVRKERLASTAADMDAEEERKRRYRHYLSLARTENFSELNKLGALYGAGGWFHCLCVSDCLCLYLWNDRFGIF